MRDTREYQNCCDWGNFSQKVEFTYWKLILLYTRACRQMIAKLKIGYIEAPLDIDITQSLYFRSKGVVYIGKDLDDSKVYCGQSGG